MNQRIEVTPYIPDRAGNGRARRGDTDDHSFLHRMMQSHYWSRR